MEEWLVHFLRDEMQRRGFERAVVGVSGGVDSAVTAYLAARALGADERRRRADALSHVEPGEPRARAARDRRARHRVARSTSAPRWTAISQRARRRPGAPRQRDGAHAHDHAVRSVGEASRAIPLGTGNKTERLFGYFTWHADDSPPINPLGDLFKTQVWALARHLGVPDVIVGKPPSADLVVGQTDEGDFGISYAKADELLNWMLNGYGEEDLIARGFDAAEVALVRKRLASTHWKRRLPTVAMISSSAIGESYLRPVDY